MILASQNVQIAEERDFVREKISGIFFVNTTQTKEHCESSALLFGNEAHLRFMFAKPMHHYLDASLILCYNKYKNVNQI